MKYPERKSKMNKVKFDMPGLRPEYKEKLKRIMRGKHYSQEEFDKMVG